MAGVTAVGAVGGADDTSPSTTTSAVAGNDDGTPDQGPGDLGGTGSTSTSTTASTTVVPPAATRTIPVPGVGEVVITEGRHWAWCRPRPWQGSPPPPRSRATRST